MKSFTCILLWAFAMQALAVSPMARLERAADEMVSEFSEAVNEGDEFTIDGTSTPDKIKIIETLQESLAAILEKIRIRVEERHQSAQDLLEKAKEIAVRLQELHARKGEKVKALLERLHGRIKDLVSSFLNKLAGRNKRSITETEEELLEMLQLDKIFIELLKRSEELKEQFLAKLEEKLGHRADKVREWIDSYVHPRMRRQAPGNTVDKVRQWFKETVDHLKGRYADFLDWLVVVWNHGIAQAKGHHARLVAIAKEVIEDAKTMHKETLREALEILKPYKEELGNLYNEMVDAVNQALQAQ